MTDHGWVQLEKMQNMNQDPHVPAGESKPQKSWEEEVDLGACYSPLGSFVSRQETWYLNGLCVQYDTESVIENRIYFNYCDS